MKPFNFIPLKFQDFGKRKLNLRTKKKNLFKSVKNISVLNVAFSKSVLGLIKKWVYSDKELMMELYSLAIIPLVCF